MHEARKKQTLPSNTNCQAASEANHRGPGVLGSPLSLSHHTQGPWALLSHSLILILSASLSPYLCLFGLFLYLFLPVARCKDLHDYHYTVCCSPPGHNSPPHTPNHARSSHLTHHFLLPPRSPLPSLPLSLSLSPSLSLPLSAGGWGYLHALLCLISWGTGEMGREKNKRIKRADKEKETCRKETESVK